MVNIANMDVVSTSCEMVMDINVTMNKPLSCSYKETSDIIDYNPNISISTDSIILYVN